MRILTRNLFLLFLILGGLVGWLNSGNLNGFRPFPSIQSAVEEKRSHELMIGTSPDKPTIILVPGFNPVTVLLGEKSSQGTTCTSVAKKWEQGRDSHFLELPRWLQSDGFEDIRIANYQNNFESTPSIEKNAECIRTQILAALNTSKSGQIVIIAHSLGGLIVRSYIDSPVYEEDVQSVGRNFISSVFLASVPNQGMPFHFWLNLLLQCEKEDSKQRAACEFSSTQWVTEFNQRHPHTNLDVKYYALGGTWYNGWFGYLVGTYICLCMGPNDATIPTLSAISLPGVYQTAVFNESHDPAVGKPTYFEADSAKQSSDIYENCLRQVLVFDKENGCQSSASLVCPYMSETILFLIILGSLSLFWKRLIAFGRVQIFNRLPLRWKKNLHRFERFVIAVTSLVAGNTRRKATLTYPCTKPNHLSAVELQRLLTHSEGNQEKLAGILRGKCLEGEILTGLNLKSLNFEGCNLYEAILEGSDLSDCNLTKANLEKARLYKAKLVGCNLANSNLQDADLSNADLTHAKLYGANLTRVNFAGTLLDKTYLRSKSIGKQILQDQEDDFPVAREIYLRLEENFQAIGAFDDTAWAYFQGRVMERNTFSPLQARKNFGGEEELDRVPFWKVAVFYLKYLLKWIWAYLQEAIWGYGQKPLRVIGFCLFIILFFAILFQSSGGIVSTPPRELTLLDYFNYSLASFTTSSLSDLQASTLFAQLLTSLDGIFGVSTLALFTTALARRMGGG